MRPVLATLLFAACLAASSFPVLAQETQQGELRILLRGQPIGRERYQITRTATEVSARGEIELQVNQEKLRQTSNLLLSADLSPRSYEWTMEEPKKVWVRMRFEGAVAAIRYPLPDGKEDEQTYDFGAARVALLDVNVFHHFLLLAQLYDFQAGGVQTLKVFVPQAVQPGEAQIKLEEVETLPLDGQPQPVRRLSITTEDNRVLLWVTPAGRFVRLLAPQGGVEVLPAPAP